MSVMACESSEGAKIVKTKIRSEGRGDADADADAVYTIDFPPPLK